MTDQQWHDLRAVLATGTPAAGRAAVERLLAETPAPSRLVLSCAGGMPPGVSTENLRAICAAARNRGAAPARPTGNPDSQVGHRRSGEREPCAASLP